jgi:hypothetical protein
VVIFSIACSIFKWLFSLSHVVNAKLLLQLLEMFINSFWNSIQYVLFLLPKNNNFKLKSINNYLHFIKETYNED